ncbi:MAG: AAA family ATPase [Syntrophobacteraceae bacterium]|jgi:lon-related putative ATP-dependent protease
MITQHNELAVEKLRLHINQDLLPFESTASLRDLEFKVVGQERAVDAIRFGVKIKKKGYNLFIAGPPKSGLASIARTFVEEQAKMEKRPPDWCYVHNFKQKDNPKAISLCAGRGRELKGEMDRFVKTLQEKIPEVFTSHEFGAKDREVHEGFEKRRQQLVEALAEEGRGQGFVLQFSQLGMALLPAGQSGQPLSAEEMEALTPEDMALIRSKSDELQAKMRETVKQIQQAEGEFREIHSQLEREVALFIVGQLMETVEEKFADEPRVIEYLREAESDILDNIDDFKKKPEPPAQAQMQPQPQQHGVSFPGQEIAFRKYEVNVFVDNSQSDGAPVLIESNPSYSNLFGSIEKQAWFGALITDHTMLKAGALHRANGGYLVINALDLLRANISYEALQRALRDEEIKIEEAGDLYGFFGTRSLKPEPFPLDLKIILTGDPEIYQLLYANDDRFKEHFKVKAHMDSQVDVADSVILEYARALAHHCAEHELLDLDRSGVARVIEYAMERTENQEKLTLELEDVVDLLVEADFFARQGALALIGASHVEEAIKKRKYRASLYEERIKEVIKKDIFWVETDGWKVGQVNGLSVLQTGDHVFGQPNRITATVSVGKEGAISIDREAKMSGATHTKGLLTLGSFIRERFAQDKPLALTAALSFEQSYSMIDGDSASSTELYAILSAISDVPIYQGIAVTGSVSQKGEVQPIGGVNYKIKGFFDICRHKGFTGKQGVVIPSKNVRNLMLDEEVIEAVKEGNFHIWPVSTIEEGLEVLTTQTAGRQQEDGSYPEGTLFRKVDDRLRKISDIVHQYGRDSENGTKSSREEETVAGVLSERFGSPGSRGTF